MSTQDAAVDSFDVLRQWYDTHRPSQGEDPKPYVICVGLAVLERMRAAFPLSRSDYVTPGNQVRTSGRLIRLILARHGEERRFMAEGGRTTRGTVPAAEALAAELNLVEGLGGLGDETRLLVIDKLQAWLVDRVRDYFGRQRIAVEINLTKPSPQIIGDVIVAAGLKSGAVAQHLVGAKLAVRFPDLDIENHSYTTADQQLGRPGDFLVRDTVFHVTVAPMPPVLDKCLENFRNGYRPLLLVPESRVQAAKQMAESIEAQDGVSIFAIESFVGQNIEELGGFGKDNLADSIKELIATYNERVGAVESDRSLLIAPPANL